MNDSIKEAVALQIVSELAFTIKPYVMETFLKHLPLHDRHTIAEQIIMSALRTIVESAE